MHRTAVIRRIGAASLQDLRLSCRTWLRAKAFTALAVLTLATGIAATAIVWSLVDGVLLRPLPMPEQDRLLVAWKTAPASADTRWPFRAPEIDVIREAARGIEAIAGVGYQDPSRVIALENGSASYLHLSRVTGDFFHVLGVRPVLGRTLGRDDDAIGAERVAVITHGLWQRRYGGARNVLGRRFIVNEQPFTIVGVMPRGIDYPRGVEGWVTRTGQAWLTGVFALIAVLLAAIGVYGVLAALVRLREREIGIRLAFGAGRTHVRGLVLGEALRLAGIGAAVGLALAIGGSGVLRGLLFGVTPLDPAALLGAACLLVASCAAACCVPVRRATRIDPAALLRAE